MESDDWVQARVGLAVGSYGGGGTELSISSSTLTGGGEANGAGGAEGGADEDEAAGLSDIPDMA